MILTGREGNESSLDKSNTALSVDSSLRAARLCGLRTRTLCRRRFSGLVVLSDVADGAIYNVM